jgi:hypothetical protein
MAMPKLPFDEMSAVCDDSKGNLILAARNSRSKCLRASKPFPKIDFDGDEERALWEGSANYVWRMLCFDFATSRPHCCMPCTADWDIAVVFRNREIRGDYAGLGDGARQNAVREYRESLDALIKQAESVMSVTAQAGVMQWGRALGMV